MQWKYNEERILKDIEDYVLSTYHGFDWVICAAPAPQTRALLPPWFSAFDLLDEVQFSACFALMLGFSQTCQIS